MQATGTVQQESSSPTSTPTVSDVTVFGLGSFVCMMVAGAVGLLLWGAELKPGEDATNSQVGGQMMAGPLPASPSPLPVGGLESRSPA
ncbi:MAG: hypothetical protein ACI835_005332 [Planctomycetota bacterium]|jgi:hypothetical protein